MSHSLLIRIKLRQHLIAIATLSTLALSISMPSRADITELDSKELTETYIKDSTIVVKKRATPESEEADKEFNINPIGPSPALLEHDRAIVNTQEKELERKAEDLLRETHLQDLIQQDNTINTGQAVLAPYRTEAQIARDQFIKQELGLPLSQPLDLTTLGFGPGTYEGNLDLNDGRSVSFPNNSFQIVIPNTKAIDPTSFSNHDNTFNTTITPESIILQIVNPHIQQ